MSNLIKEIKICSVCKKESEQVIILSTNTFGGAPDLDLRPPEMKRSTMPYWLEMCPHCLYVSNDISKETKIKEDDLLEEKYKNVKGNEICKKFYRNYLISLKDNDTYKAFISLRNAAWSCDDENNYKLAKELRNKAIELVEKLILDEKDNRNKEAMICVRADLLRRSDNFEKLIEECSNLELKEEIPKQIMKFQIEKAKLKDNKVYKISDAVKKG